MSVVSILRGDQVGLCIIYLNFVELVLVWEFFREEVQVGLYFWVYVGIGILYSFLVWDYRCFSGFGVMIFGKISSGREFVCLFLLVIYFVFRGICVQFNQVLELRSFQVRFGGWGFFWIVVSLFLYIKRYLFSQYLQFTGFLGLEGVQRFLFQRRFFGGVELWYKFFLGLSGSFLYGFLEIFGYSYSMCRLQFVAGVLGYFFRSSFSLRGLGEECCFQRLVFMVGNFVWIGF